MPVNWPEGGKRLPLWDAVYAGNTSVVQKLLLTPGGAAQVNLVHGLWQQTSVHVAVARGNAKLLKHLLFTAGDPNARSINGTTPLHLAAEQNRRDLVQDLLLAGANPRLRNYTGQTPIELASNRGFTQLVSLLRQGADSKKTLASLEGAALQTASRRSSAQLLRPM